jgi:hypothetical protein
MVSGFIFILHFILIVYAFLKNKKHGFGEGILAVAFVGIVFAVSWTIAAIITNLIFTPDWFVKWYWQPLDSWVWQVIRKEISRDTISLLILTGIEVIFYYFYLYSDPESKGKNNTDDNSSSIAV